MYVILKKWDDESSFQDTYETRYSSLEEAQEALNRFETGGISELVLRTRLGMIKKLRLGYEKFSIAEYRIVKLK